MDGVRNARIRSTMLGVEDHGMLTFYLLIEGDGWSQGFGGYVADDGPFLAESVRRILDTLEVRSWEALTGQLVRIDGSGTKMRRIGHIYKDKWYDIVAHAADAQTR